MKKVLFFALLLITLGAASVRAQVRIGGDGAPHAAAVLDLNATDATVNGNRGLALPRVSLATETTKLNGANPKDGTLVYNTNSSFGVGLYYWLTNKWVKLQVGSDFLEKDSVIGNEVTNATASGGLSRAGSGTAEDPFTLGIAPTGVTAARIAANAVTTAKIANLNVTLEKLADNSVNSAKIVDLSVGTADLADNAVATAKIADGAVTYAKLGTASASNGQVLKFTGTAWAPAAEGGAGAANGLTIIGSNVELGGTLTKATEITSAGFNLYTTGTGKVSIGAAPTANSAKFEVSGAAANTEAFSAGSSRTIDFSKSNLAYTTASAGAFTLNNLKNGGAYTLAVQGATSATSTFTARNIAGTTLTVKIVNSIATVASTHTLYTILVMGTTAYVFVNTGF